MAEPASISALARKLLSLTTYREIKAFRAQLDSETARAVITSSLLSPADRGAISLLINFGAPNRYGYSEGALVAPTDDTCAELQALFTLPVEASTDHGRPSAH